MEKNVEKKVMTDNEEIKDVKEETKILDEETTVFQDLVSVGKKQWKHCKPNAMKVFIVGVIVGVWLCVFITICIPSNCPTMKVKYVHTSDRTTTSKVEPLYVWLKFTGIDLTHSSYNNENAVMVNGNTIVIRAEIEFAVY